jgi:hypothetical protein
MKAIARNRGSVERPVTHEELGAPSFNQWTILQTETPRIDSVTRLSAIAAASSSDQEGTCGFEVLVSAY